MTTTTQTRSMFKIFGGKEKGRLLHDASDDTLRWWFNKVADGLVDDPQKQFAEKDRQWLGDAKKILVERGFSADELNVPAGGNGSPARPANGGAQRQAQNGTQRRAPATSTAITQGQPQQLVVGTFNNSQVASAALLEAAKNYHLVSPATIVGRLPEGCEVAISLVQVDPYGREVYQITGSKENPKDDDTVGLDRVALAKIASAAGVSWKYSRRTDDGSHPHYCAWEAVAIFTLFDMTKQEIPGNVEIDTRESDDDDLTGAAAAEIRKKAAAKSDKGDAQLLELRKFIIRHAESKAMNKAIGNKGVHRSYKRADLKKPFAVARLVFTGHSDDPEARRDFRQMIGQAFLGSAATLYGGHQQPAPVLAPAQAAPQFMPHSPPPMGTRIDQGYGDYSYDEIPAPPPTPRPAGESAASGQQQPGGSDDEELEDPYSDRGPDADNY
ncbi:MAG: hypothetical protein HOW73_20260 [Polyangiaceae bacterium]|nr:hypothetical protein [Polyangiaceae bacterium]